ncbi:MAG: hypothetical protein KDA96_04945 [Planctomycetaceae bacterium]|nr:hypothetical protein [Planctomycetaceae bacterium]
MVHGERVSDEMTMMVFNPANAGFRQAAGNLSRRKSGADSRFPGGHAEWVVGYHLHVLCCQAVRTFFTSKTAKGAFISSESGYVVLGSGAADQ